MVVYDKFGKFCFGFWLRLFVKYLVYEVIGLGKIWIGLLRCDEFWVILIYFVYDFLNYSLNRIIM